jgi:hypothetical protein
MKVEKRKSPHKILFKKINQMADILHVACDILKKTYETSGAEYSQPGFQFVAATRRGHLLKVLLGQSDSRF